MNEWQLAAAILGAALIPCMAVCALCRPPHALAAVEVAGAVVTTILMLLSEGLHRQPFIDLALTFALISSVGALAFARMMEQDI